MWLFWLMFIVIIIMLIKAFVKPSSNDEAAMDILKKRYAKGEISKDEFEERKKTLQS